MLRFIISCIYFFLPAYFTNMTPPLANTAGILKSLATPIDFNRKLNGKAILGSHKTWRGVILGILIGISMARLQKYLYQFPTISELSLINYEQVNILFFGLLLSGGAILGDLTFAFIKRRLDLKPGTRFLPFDQTNYVIGAAILTSLFFKINISVWLTLFFLSFFLHILINRLGFILKLHGNKW